jgi:hypothetical protein
MSTIRINTTSAIRCRKCSPVIYRHEDGWDIYPISECYRAPDGTWIPAWFDGSIVQDAETRKAALEELAGWHVLGFCLVGR